jgi:type I restriction enzyme, S subunit
MGLKPGYKQTEVGVIPEEWSVQSCADVCVKIQDGTHFSPSTGGNDFLYVTSKNIGFGVLNVSYAARISSAQHKAIYRRCDVRFGDLLLTKDGANTGNAALNTLEEEFSLLSSVAFLRFDPKKHIAGYFLQQILSNFGQRRIKDAMAGNAITRLTLDKIRKLQFPVPPLLEQRAIAEALSDVDALIGELDRLIAKKRDLKQAAMQELLTGQKRLPGFSGEWEVKRLGELADIISGGTPKTTEPSYWNGGINWCTPTDITGCPGRYLVETERTISEVGLASCAAHVLPIGTLLLCSRATVGEVRIAGCEVCTNQGFKSLVCKEDINNEFLYYKLLTMKQQIIERAIGSTFLEISKRETTALELRIPDYTEQTAIAEVLADMDAEIAALERRRDKTRALKQGMTQELLTGRTRLVDSSANYGEQGI